MSRSNTTPSRSATPPADERRSECAFRLSDAVLPGDQKRSPATSDHLDQCPDCRSEAESWQTIETRLALPARATPAWEQLEQKILAAQARVPKPAAGLWDLLERLRQSLFPAEDLAWTGNFALTACLVLLVWIGLQSSSSAPQPSFDLKKEFMTASIQRLQEFGRLHGPVSPTSPALPTLPPAQPIVPRSR